MANLDARKRTFERVCCFAPVHVFPTGVPFGEDLLAE